MCGRRRGSFACRGGMVLAVQLAILQLVLAGCDRSAKGAGSNLVLISIDTLRADHLGAYGYARPTSPNIDRLAASGVVFESAFAPSSWTLPSHASMLTGVSPYRHGAVRADAQIAPDVRTLAEDLRAHGYQTVGFVNAPFVGARFGFARGFDRFEEQFERRLPDPQEYQRNVLAAIPELREPFFLFVHYMDVHLPYRPPKRFNVFARSKKRPRIGKQQEVQRELEEGRRTLTDEQRNALVDFYDAEILAMDTKLAELLDALRSRFPDTLVVLTSDHGEEFLEHGNVFHARTLYDEVLHVPLIVAGPGVARGRIATMASLLDIVPSALDWLGAPSRGGIEGRSFARSLATGKPAGEPSSEHALSLHTSGPFGRISLRGVRTQDGKLLRDDVRATSELFDLSSDPGEQRNLAPARRDERLERLLETLRPPATVVAPSPDAKTIESLEALGYL